MSLRDRMRESDENLGWCKTYISEDKRAEFIRSELGITHIAIDGKTLDVSPENIEKLARVVNPDYDDYEGWSDLHIIYDGNIDDIPCRLCPYFEDCYAMDEE